MEKKNENNINPYDTKQQLLKDLSENLDLDGENEANTNINNAKEVKAPLQIISDPNNEISCIMPLKAQKDKMDKVGDCTIINIFGDDDNTELISFYGDNMELEKIVKNLEGKDKKSKEPEGYLPVVNFYKINNEQLNKLTKSVNQKDLIVSPHYLEIYYLLTKKICTINFK